MRHPGSPYFIFIALAATAVAQTEEKPDTISVKPAQSDYYIYRALLHNSDGGTQVAVSRGRYVVNFGTREGVKPGSIFRVVRHETYLGLVRVDHTWRDSAAVSLVNLEIKADLGDPMPFARGDRLFPEYVLLETVHFAAGAPLISAEMHKRLRYTARFVLSFPDFPVVLEGHTDNTGEREANIELGQSRAREIRRFLNEIHLVPMEQMHTIGYADDRPIATNSTPAGRKRNRRVDIVLAGGFGGR